MSLAQPTDLKVQGLELLVATHQEVREKLITVEQWTGGAHPPQTLVTASQRTRRYNASGTPITLSQGVYHFHPAGAIVTAEQRMRRYNASGTPITFSQGVRSHSPAGVVVSLGQLVERHNAGGTALTLSQDVLRYFTAASLVIAEQWTGGALPPHSLVILAEEVRRHHVSVTLAQLGQDVRRHFPVVTPLVFDQQVKHPLVVDWEASAPAERQTIYLLDIGDLRVPISSAQATMKRDGQSFLQAVIPAGVEWIDALEAERGAMMRLRKGYRYADDSLSTLEAIAEAPFQQLRSDEGPTSNSVTISGYGAYALTTDSRRELRQVRYRSINDGVRRVRANVDLFLRPGHEAIDADGTEIRIATIQYFINASSEFMEVLQEG